MAVSIGPRIGIEGENEYRKALQNIIQETKTLKSEMQAVESSFDKDTKTKEKNRKQLEVLRKQQEALRKEQEQLNDAAKKAAEVYGEDSTQALKWKDSLNKCTTQLNEVENKIKEMTGPESFAEKMQLASEKLKAVGDTMQEAGRTLSTRVTAPLVGVGTAAVKVSADFEAGMSKVAAISGATGSEFESLQAKAQEMGTKTKFSATEAADAMSYMSMAGWKAEDMLSGIEGVMNLAAASGEDLATTSDIVTDALTAFGLTAADSGHFADVLAAASSNANTNVSMMGETFKYAAPIAGALGFSVEDTAAAIGLMANAGIKGSQAGTSLRNIMTALSGEVKIAGENIGEVEIATTNADGSMRDLSAILVDCRTAFAGLSESEKAAAAESIAGKNAMSGFLALMNAGEGDVSKLTTAINSADGSAEAMAQTMNNNLNGQITLLKSALEGAAISIGNTLVPQISGLVEKVQGGVEWFNSLSDSQKRLVVTIGEIAAAAGPVLLIGGKMISGIGSIVGAVGKAHTAFAAVGPLMSGTIVPAVTSAASAFGAFIVPILPIVGVIGGVVAAGVLLYKNWDTIKEKAGKLKEGVSQAWSNLKSSTSSTFANLKSATDEKWNSIKSSISNKINSAKDTVKSAIDKIKGFFNFSWSLPKLKMPHISITGSFSLMPPSVPHFSIDWYAKAMENGMILNSPTIFGMAGGRLLGGGEAGAEAVVGVRSLRGMISGAVAEALGQTSYGTQYGDTTINVYGAPGQDVRELADIIERRLAANVNRRAGAW